MKKNVLLILSAAALLAGCTKSGEQKPLVADFDISSNPCFAKEEITFTSRISGGESPYTYEWQISSLASLSGEAVKYTFDVNGTYVITLKVNDASGKIAQKKKNLVVNPANIQETGKLTLNWVGRMEGYNTMSSAAIDDEGNVYSTCRDNNLYKFDRNGNLLWKKAIFTPSADGSTTMVTPSIDSDGVVFIGGGSNNGDGVFVAFNPDGTEKWRFRDFFTTGALMPTVSGIIPGIGDKNIYVGNTGTSGSVIAIDKATGARADFCKHGTGGPVGGARNGILISKANTLHWYGGVYGFFGADKTLFDNGGNSGVDYKWHIYNSSSSVEFAQVASSSTLAAHTIGGKAVVSGIVTDKTSTKIYTVDCLTGAEVSVVRIQDTDSQDQGGVVVTKDGYVVASLAYTLGQDNGGIVIGDPETGEIVARYSVQEKVSGAPAVDKAGNIHFASEAGFYYIVKRNGAKCDLLLKQNLATVVTEDGRYSSSFSALQEAKVWSSVMIGDDGKMYICFTDADSRKFGGVACLSFEGCTGPADSQWPMAGHDRRHTNRQL